MSTAPSLAVSTSDVKPVCSLVVMRVDTQTADALHCTVLIGGPLSDHKGINRRGGGLTAPALTEKDKLDIKLAAEMELDYLAVSFPRDAADMEYARKLL